MDEKQNFDIDLMQIIPEYYSNNKIVRDLFLTRLKYAIDYCKQIGTKKLLDAGCGDGLLFMNINKNNNVVEEMIGIDMNEYVEELNRTYPFAQFLKRDITKMLFCDNYFDTVTCLDVLEHFEDIRNPIKEIRRVLKKDRYLIVSGPVESFFYKLGRFIIKGKFSGETGPGAGKHYHNIKQIDKLLTTELGFVRIEQRKIRVFCVNLFDVNLYKKL